MSKTSQNLYKSIVSTILSIALAWPAFEAPGERFHRDDFSGAFVRQALIPRGVWERHVISPIPRIGPRLHRTAPRLLETPYLLAGPESEDALSLLVAFDRIRTIVPLEFSSLRNVKVRPSDWPPLTTASGQTSPELTVLLLMPELVADWVGDESPAFFNALVLSEAVGFYRQLSFKQQNEIRREAEAKGLAAWIDMLANTATVRQGKFLETISRLTGKATHYLEWFLQARDRIVDRSRGLRIASEFLTARHPTLSISPVLELMHEDFDLFKVISGLQPGAILARPLTSNDESVLRQLFWGLRQIQGTHLQLLELPDQRWVIYDVRWMQQEAFDAGEISETRTEGVTQQGLEHRIKKDAIAGHGYFLQLLSQPPRGAARLTRIPALRHLMASVLAQPLAFRFTQWDEAQKIYRAARTQSLCRRVMSVLPPSVESAYIATIDRPVALALGLEAEAENYRIFNRPIRRITVVDDSKPEFLKENRKTLGRLREEFGISFTHISARDRRAEQAYYAYWLAEDYQRQLDSGRLDYRIKNLLSERDILVRGRIDVRQLNRHLQSTVFDHISGVRNFTLLAASGEHILHFDDDAPPETYVPLERDLAALRANRLKARSQVAGEFKERVSEILHRPLRSDLDLYVALHEVPAAKQSRILALESEFFGYASSDSQMGRIPRAMGEIVSRESLEIDRLRQTHQRYDPLMNVPDQAVTISDFDYSRPRREKSSGAFDVMPVDVIGGARYLGKTPQEAHAPIFKNDLRGTIGLPVWGRDAKDLAKRPIVYSPYSFVLDQDTSGLAQFYRYLTMAQKAIHNLQHTDQIALVVEGISAAAGLMFVIFNRAAIDNSFPLPTIGRDLRFEEPPYVQWVVEPISAHSIAMAFSPVAGGQQRSIAERLYRISYQDLTEVMGVLAAAVYREAVQDFFANPFDSGRDHRTRRLGQSYIDAGRRAELSEAQKNSALQERQRRAHLLGTLGEQLAVERGASATDLMTVLIQYAHDFHLYRAVDIGRKNFEPQTSTDYFYRVKVVGDVLEWAAVLPESVETATWSTLSGRSGSQVLPKENGESQELLELEPGRFIQVPKDRAGLVHVVAPLPVANEKDYLDEMQRRIRGQLQADGGTLVIWPDLLRAAAELIWHREGRPEAGSMRVNAPRLRMALESENINVQLGAIESLGQLDTALARTALQEVSEGADDRIQRLIGLTLDRGESVKRRMWESLKKLATEWNDVTISISEDGLNGLSVVLTHHARENGAGLEKYLKRFIDLARQHDCVVEQSPTSRVPQRLDLRLHKREIEASGRNLYPGVKAAFDLQRRVLGVTRNQSSIEPFFQIWENGKTVDNLIVYKDGRRVRFNGTLPAAVAEDPAIHRIIFQNAQRAKRPNRAGGTTPRMEDGAPSLLWPEVAPEDHAQLRIRWMDPHERPWNLMFNPFSYWPPHHEASPDDVIQLVIARADSHVSQKAMSALENLESMAALFLNLLMSTKPGEAVLRLGINGWYGSEAPGAPKAGATQSQAHAQGLNRRFPIENYLFVSDGEIDGVAVAHLAPELMEGTGIRLDVPLRQVSHAVKLAARILEEVGSRGNSYNVLFAPGADSGHLRLFITERPVGTPLPHFSNEWASLEVNGFVLVDDLARFYDLSPEEQHRLEKTAASEVPHWLHELREQRIQQGKELKIHPAIVGDAPVARRSVTASQRDTENTLLHLRSDSLLAEISQIRVSDTFSIGTWDRLSAKIQGIGDWRTRVNAHYLLAGLAPRRLLKTLGNQRLSGPRVSIAWPKRSTKPNAAVVLLDDFRPEERPSGDGWTIVPGHGERVERRLQDVLPRGTRFDKVQIDVQDGPRTEPLLWSMLHAVVNRHPGSIIIVNASLGYVDPSHHLVNGIFPVDEIRRLGEKGVIFVVPAGNRSPAGDTLMRVGYPQLPNVLVVAAADSEKGRISEESQFGPDVFLASPKGDLKGYTSLAVPQVVAALYKAFSEDPSGEIESVIERVRAQAKPMLEEPHYLSGWLGAGLLTSIVAAFIALRHFGGVLEAPYVLQAAVTSLILPREVSFRHVTSRAIKRAA